MSYINREFRDQVWNKDFGFHDLKAKLEGKTITKSQRDQFGAGPSEEVLRLTKRRTNDISTNGQQDGLCRSLSP